MQCICSWWLHFGLKLIYRPNLSALCAPTKCQSSLRLYSTGQMGKACHAIATTTTTNQQQQNTIFLQNSYQNTADRSSSPQSTFQAPVWGPAPRSPQICTRTSHRRRQTRVPLACGLFHHAWVRLYVRPRDTHTKFTCGFQRQFKCLHGFGGLWRREKERQTDRRKIICMQCQISHDSHWVSQPPPSGPEQPSSLLLLCLCVWVPAMTRCRCKPPNSAMFVGRMSCHRRNSSISRGRLEPVFSGSCGSAQWWCCALFLMRETELLLAAIVFCRPCGGGCDGWPASVNCFGLRSTHTQQAAIAAERRSEQRAGRRLRLRTS